MDRYVCTVCGHVYDPEKGEPKLDLPPGTAFPDLPDTWQCPVCFADKSEFKKE
ncbi:MAG: rubredoxin [Methanoregula sp.]|nr:rubredoxin [Methanoregula sp.]